MSNDANDPGLNHGYAYFVEENAYKTHLLLHAGDTQEVFILFFLHCCCADSWMQKSTCSGHSAVNLANTKKSCGLAATGVGTIDCARHNMKLPTAIGDLQKGEKYVLYLLRLAEFLTCKIDILIWITCSSLP